jgi:hypothetical protein
MSKSPESKRYRALAEECDRQAQATLDPDAKIRFYEQARRWRELEIQAVLSKRS